MHIFFVHFGFGLEWCMYVKSLLSLRFLFHVCGVFGVILCEGLFFLRRGRCVLSYPSDALSDDITALISTAPTLAAAADSIATIQSGTDVVVSNFAGVEAVFDKLQAFLSELQSGHFYTPVGALMPFAGLSGYVPSGWLVCDGSSYVASGASSDLQTILNAAGFSALPDLRGRVVAGVDSTGLTDINANSTRLRPVSATAATIGGVIGDARPQNHNHTGTVDSHTHSIQQNWLGETAGMYHRNNDVFASGDSIGNGGGSNYRLVGTGYTSPGLTTTSVGGGAQQNVQPTLMLNYIIKN